MSYSYGSLAGGEGMGALRNHCALSTLLNFLLEKSLLMRPFQRSHEEQLDGVADPEEFQSKLGTLHM